MNCLTDSPVLGGQASVSSSWEISSRLDVGVDDSMRSNRVCDNRNVRSHRISGSLLPPDFKLTPYTIIVGRGKETKENPGNKWLKGLAVAYLDQYSKAKNDKRVKSNIVSEIIATVMNSEGGGFIKRTNKNNGGQWYEVEDSAAREKVGYVFRDLLSENYRSSSKSKFQRELTRKKQQQQQLQQRDLLDKSVLLQAPDYGNQDFHTVSQPCGETHSDTDKLTFSRSFFEEAQQCQYPCTSLKAVFDIIPPPCEKFSKANDFSLLPLGENEFFDQLLNIPLIAFDDFELTGR